jgi:Uma2 family endonuclease
MVQWMNVQEKLYTVEEFEAFVNLPQNADLRFELIQGEIHEVPSAKPIHAYIISVLVRVLGNLVEALDAGWIFADSVDFYLPNGDVFIPDVSFTSKKRQPTLPDRFEIAPDLAVEVVSPSNSMNEILKKVESYIACGTQIVWVVYPNEKAVDVWRPAGDDTLTKQKIDINGTLDGSDVLPGLSLPVKEIFQGV